MVDRFERLTNLVAILLETPRALTLEELVERVPGYPPDKASYRRQFERDKDAIRGLSIPLSVESSEWGGEYAYRIHRKDYELPDLGLDADELAALHAAVAAVHLEGGEGREALWKLGGPGGVDLAPGLLGALPTVPALPTLVDASRRRAPVRFSHRGVARHLQPFVVFFRAGNWYLVGHDEDRGEVRAFRADRIDGPVEVGEPGSFERPDDFDAEAVFHDEPWRYGDEPPLDARVRVDGAVASWVTQRLGDEAVVERDDDGGVVVRLQVTNVEAFRSFILGLLDHAEVLEPPELRALMVEWLEALAGAR